ncbi:MAG TPA: type II secretion system protein [Desulfatiglandales bacterium]|nr:type II secretion system protein [Desulfatiglandales bacterium]
MKDISNRKGKDHGFTLLEIIICLGLIALVLVAVFHLQAQNLDLQSEAQFMTTATCLLQERLSQIQALEQIEEGTNSGDFGKDYPDYTYTQEVSEVPDTETLYKVKVAVILERDKARRDLWLETYLYRQKI